MEEITLRREEQVKKFDDLVRRLREQWKDTRTNLEKDIRDITEVRAVLEHIKKDTKSNRYHEIRNILAEVRNVEEKYQVNSAAEKHLRLPTYTENTAEDVCGKLTMTKFHFTQQPSKGTALPFSHTTGYCAGI